MLNREGHYTVLQIQPRTDAANLCYRLLSPPPHEVHKLSVVVRPERCGLHQLELARLNRKK